MTATRSRSLALVIAALLAPGALAAQDPPEPPAAVGGEPVERTVLTESTALAEAPAPASTGEEYTLSASELAELGLSAEGDDATVEDKIVDIHGYVDFGLFFVMSEDWRPAILPHPAFFIGNFNLYVSKELTDTVRMFSEIRFLYLPNGIVNNTTTTVTSTLIEDYADIQRPALKWGGIEIERVYLEWSIRPWLALRVGQFLTPYGIWNVDHGSPTIIPVTRPYSIGLALFPERQTGFELRGRVALSAAHAIGYHLTLSNGLGPATEYKDLDDNKAIGARLFWSFEGLGRLTVGASGFVGTDADTQIVYSLDSRGRVAYREQVNSKADILALAADIQWTYDDLVIQAEFVSRQTAYTDDGRPVTAHPLSGVRMARLDKLEYGGYALAGYRFDWLGIMPYVLFNFVNYVEPALFSKPKPYVFQAGLNIRPIDAVVVKAEYELAYFRDGFILSDEKALNSIHLQLAWAF